MTELWLATRKRSKHENKHPGNQKQVVCNVGRCLICTDYNVTNSGPSSSQSVDNVLRASVHYT